MTNPVPFIEPQFRRESDCVDTSQIWRLGANYACDRPSTFIFAGKFCSEFGAVQSTFYWQNDFRYVVLSASYCSQWISFFRRFRLTYFGGYVVRLDICGQQQNGKITQHTIWSIRSLLLSRAIMCRNKVRWSWYRLVIFWEGALKVRLDYVWEQLQRKYIPMFWQVAITCMWKLTQLKCL